MSSTPRLISRATFASTSRPALASDAVAVAVRNFSSSGTISIAPNRNCSLRKSSPSYCALTLRTTSASRQYQDLRNNQGAIRRWASSTIDHSSSSSSPSRPDLPPSLAGGIGSSSSVPRIRVDPPSLQAIKDEGFAEDNVELVPEAEANLIITPEAVQQLANITSREPPDVLSKGLLALRVGVESGGCHGYQYSMALTEERGVDDYVMTPEGVESIPVVIDLMSLGLMKGATLHHATELIGSSFRIQDNPQAKEGGACGCGVSWEAKP